MTSARKARDRLGYRLHHFSCSAQSLAFIKFEVPFFRPDPKLVLEQHGKGGGGGSDDSFLLNFMHLSIVCPTTLLPGIGGDLVGG